MTGIEDDDWFPQPDTTQPVGDARLSIEDEWLVEEEPPPAPAFDPWVLANRRVLVPLGLAVVFLLAILAAAGAFSSSPAHVSTPAVTAPPPTITTSTAPTTSATTTTTAATAPTMTLKPGDKGPQVKVLQRELESLGYSVGTIDGDYGTATTQAVTAFQRAKGLTADGVVGSKTLAALSP